MLTRVVLAVILLILPGCSQSGPEEIHMSIINLLATPDVYHGKKVTVIGIVRMDFEGTTLYLHREDYENLIPSNAL